MLYSKEQYFVIFNFNTSKMNFKWISDFSDVSNRFLLKSFSGKCYSAQNLKIFKVRITFSQLFNRNSEYVSYKLHLNSSH